MKKSTRIINESSCLRKVTSNKTSKNGVDKFAGKWKSPKTADEIIFEIKQSRNFNRKIVEF